MSKKKKKKDDRYPDALVLSGKPFEWEFAFRVKVADRSRANHTEIMAVYYLLRFLAYGNFGTPDSELSSYRDIPLTSFRFALAHSMPSVREFTISTLVNYFTRNTK